MFEDKGQKTINKLILSAKKAIKQKNPHIKKLSVNHWEIINHGSKSYVVFASFKNNIDTDTISVLITHNIETGKVVVRLGETK